MKRTFTYAALIFAACICSVFFSCSAGTRSGKKAVPAVTENKFEQTALSDLAFEILRYQVTGYSSKQDIMLYSPECDDIVKLFTATVWNEHLYPVYLVEYLCPCYTGIIDSSFCPDDIYVTPADEQEDNLLEEIMLAPPDELLVPPEDAASEKSEKKEADTQSPAEKRYCDAQQRLRLFSYGEEYLSVQEKEDGSRILVSADSSRMKRRFFDSSMRLAKRETWTLAAAAADSKLTRTETFIYSADAYKPSESHADTADSHSDSLYDEKGRVLQCSVFTVVHDEKKGDSQIPASLTEWKYTEDGKIAEEKYTGYEAGARPGSIVTAVVRRDVYTYKAKDRNPDYAFYENGMLRMHTVYSSPDTYMTTLLFDGGFKVYSYYEHGRKTKEVYMQNGAVIRSREYEQ